jgi:hypothetical protein
MKEAEEYLQFGLEKINELEGRIQLDLEDTRDRLIALVVQRELRRLERIESLLYQRDATDE